MRMYMYMQAILWPSVLDASPHVIDPRTHHEALPVTRGEKFGGVPHRTAAPPHRTAALHCRR